MFKWFKKKVLESTIAVEAPAWMVSHDKNITLILEDETHAIGTGHPNHGSILEAIRDEDWASLPALVDVPRAITTYTEGNISVNGFGEVIFNGEQIHNSVTKRIAEFYRDGLPYMPLVRFLERLMANPSRRAVEELYGFLENEGMPITKDGCFIGYKGVNEDFTDRRTSKFDNTPGQVLEMARNDVDDDARRSCSNGFHVGSQRYAANWGQTVVIVKVDPADAVSVPFDGGEKLRVCRYEVIRVEANLLTEPLFREPVAVHVDDMLEDGDLDDYDDDYLNLN